MVREIDLNEVQKHNKSTDLWIIIESKVYDVTKFRGEHPGGEEALDEVAGRDGTKEFIEVGHSQEARQIMQKYFVGNLATKDRKCEKPARHIFIAVTAAIIGVLTVLLFKKSFTK